MMVTRWLGKTFLLRDEATCVVVKAVEMVPSHLVNLTLLGRNGTLYLTARELALNLAA